MMTDKERIQELLKAFPKRGLEPVCPGLMQRAIVEAEPLARPDYVEAVDPNDLTPASDLRSGTLVALAVFVGRTRLIDNLIV